MTRGQVLLEADKIADYYQRYGHIVLRVCRDIVRNEDDAYDVLQEVYLKFWRYADRLRKPEEALSVLKRTAVSCAIDFLRSRNRRSRYYEAWRDVEEWLQMHKQQRSEEGLARQQLISVLFDTVRVDKETLQMVYLYYFDELTLEEVAQEMGFSRRSVGMKLDRFREKAMKYCRNHGIMD